MQNFVSFELTKTRNINIYFSMHFRKWLFDIDIFFFSFYIFLDMDYKSRYLDLTEV